MGKKKKSKKEYTGGQEMIVLSVPSDTVKLKVIATVVINDELKKCVSVLDSDQIAEARNDYLLLDPYDDGFATYTLSPEFEEFINFAESIDDTVTVEDVGQGYALYKGQISPDECNETMIAIVNAFKILKGEQH